MFRARHGLLTVKTMSTLSREVYGRMLTVEAFGHGEGRKLIKDAIDQFHHLSVMADGQKDYLQGTIEFYQARTNTKMTVAAERLAVIAAITLPVTALSSVLGMNVIVNAANPLGLAHRAARGHVGDVAGAAGLGQTQGLVLAAQQLLERQRQIERVGLGGVAARLQHRRPVRSQPDRSGRSARRPVRRTRNPRWRRKPPSVRCGPAGRTSRAATRIPAPANAALIRRSRRSRWACSRWRRGRARRRTT